MGGLNKQLALIDGTPVVIRSIMAFERAPEVTDIVVAAREQDIGAIRGLCEEYGITKLRHIITGGASRTESAKNAFAAVEDADIVMIHDGARPYVTGELISRIHADCVRYGAAIPAIALKDTVKFADAEGFSAGTPDRASLRAVQTPQAFRADIYRRMTASGREATDDAGLAEALGIKVKLTEGEPCNIKITTPDDLPKEEKRMLRIGHGYDVHILAPDRKLIIGGVEIPYELGLLGHSDADVLVHAVMDAMLGALALGDIGKHFPDSDPAYKGADSTELLKKVNALIREKGYRVSNLDCTINAERPKLATYIAQMRGNIAAAVGADVGSVSVKATTEEGLGLAGKGIGAVCVCLLES
jgi:2-C-methyl-D-erythritol 2,4-cyclodiphosphate synthase/2-C-methyl-D-erythritol 4-phosphate cytidylyltransferase